MITAVERINRLSFLFSKKINERKVKMGNVNVNAVQITFRMKSDGVNGTLGHQSANSLNEFKRLEFRLKTSSVS